MRKTAALGATVRQRVEPSDARVPDEGRAGETRPRAVRRDRRRRFVASVRTQVLAVFAMLLAVSTAISLILIRDVLRTRLEEEIHRQATREIGEFRRLARGNNPTTGRPFGADVAAIFDVYFSRNLPGERQVILSFIRGRRYKGISAAGAAWPVDELFTRLAAVARAGTTRRGTIDTSAENARYVSVPVIANGVVTGSFVVASFPAKERGEVDGAVRDAMEVSGLVFLLALGLAWLAAGRVLAPLRELESTAQSISESDLTRRIPVRRYDEVGHVAATFNAMLDRLEAAFAAQRSFLDDAGHELRTPITIVRGQLELLDEDPHERAETIELVMDELDRMARIVNDLVLLAKSDQPDFLDVERVDVAELTDELEAKARAIAPREWSVELRANGDVDADRQRITQALLQLAQNAVQHTSVGDKITMGSALVDGEARFWVRDGGPGIPLELQEAIFDRFARGPGARREESAGLGLSIVKAIVEAHEGRIEVESKLGDGAMFTIVLPAGPRAARRASRSQVA